MTSPFVHGLTNDRFGQMHAIGTTSRSELTVGSNQDEQSTATADGRHRECERFAALRIARAHHDHAAARQGAGSGKRIGQPLIVGH